MSKILRRPMFRGGPVDSRGTGITSGLMDGGRVGFDNGGSPFLKTPIGGQIVEAQKKKPFLNLNNLNYSAAMPFPYEKATPLNSEDKTSVVGVKDDSQEKEVDTTGSVIDGSILDSDFDTAETIDGKVVIKPRREFVGNEPGIDETTSTFFAGLTKPGQTEEYKTAKAKYKDGVVQGRDLEEDAKLSQAAYDAKVLEDAKIDDLNLDGNEESTEISAKDAVRANQELFADLLGKSKARGQDISDMLLRFSAAGGSTVGEKFKEFTKAEAKAGKSRTEKIDETAAALAIKDYIGGKRSKEQADIYKGRIDYAQKVKMDAVNVQPTDSAQQALFKIGDKASIKPTSDQAYKYLIEIKDPGAKVFRNDKVKIKDLNKPNKIKKLKTGYNIIEEDGVKNIVVYNGSGDVSGIQIFSIDELWKL